MLIREKIEQKERELLSPYACCSGDTKGRFRKEEECPLRTAFMRDRDRIIYSKAFRRLKYKTQVFLAPSEDHYRTRLTHTLEVSEIGRVLARSLNLNEDLVEAIALGHDLGHSDGLPRALSTSRSYRSANVTSFFGLSTILFQFLKLVF